MNATILACMILTMNQSADFTTEYESSGSFASIYHRFSSDRRAIERLSNFPESSFAQQRLETWAKTGIAELSKIKATSLNDNEKLDLFLLKHELEGTLEELAEQRKKLADIEAFVPFKNELEEIKEQRVARALPSARESAVLLDKIAKDAVAAKSKLETEVKTKPAKEVLPEHLSRRVQSLSERCRSVLREWYENSKGYDPEFTWWNEKSFEQADQALAAYIDLVTKQFSGWGNDPKTAIPGDPIGREELIKSLNRELIPYTPEELIKIAEEQWAWVDAEMKNCAKEMGYGDDWRKALEDTKNDYVEVGKQPELINELANEAIDYVKKNNLMNVPPLAESTWRMTMMSADRQLVSPFFLGGETIIVSFPTDGMTYEQKLMSLRANNKHFSRATVHHELIPGHHMQQFMTSRYNAHRGEIIGTPFWTEGWALYWEFLLYKRGFAVSPKERMGFLWWRKHRCARIIFSLKFHMNQMTARECVDMLVKEVGHEPNTAEGEVRRSFGGDYGPLYQVAYMMGALQLWAMRMELVDTGKMAEKDFHNAVMLNGAMPWAALRLRFVDPKKLEGKAPDWRFADVKPNF